MKIDRTGFIQYCNKKIKNNNKKIKGLRALINDYEAIIDVISRTDLNKQLLEGYRQKIEVCFSKIDHYMESNRNKYDLISVIKSANKIINENQGGKAYGK